MAKTPEEKAAEAAEKQKAAKEALVAELAKFKVEATVDESVDALKEKLKTAKAAEAAAKKAAAEPEVTEIEVKFRDQGKVTSRTFSKAVHGANFKKLADEFRTKHAARIVT
jgi:hypothetical protein